jgi:hypothetical protein
MTMKLITRNEITEYSESIVTVCTLNNKFTVGRRQMTSLPGLRTNVCNANHCTEKNIIRLN